MTSMWNFKEMDIQEHLEQRLAHDVSSLDSSCSQWPWHEWAAFRRQQGSRLLPAANRMRSGVIKGTDWPDSQHPSEVTHLTSQRRQCQEEELRGTWYFPKAGRRGPFKVPCLPAKEDIWKEALLHLYGYTVMPPALWVTAWNHLFIK